MIETRPQQHRILYVYPSLHVVAGKQIHIYSIVVNIIIIIEQVKHKIMNSSIFMWPLCVCRAVLRTYDAFEYLCVYVLFDTKRINKTINKEINIPHLIKSYDSRKLYRRPYHGARQRIINSASNYMRLAYIVLEGCALDAEEYKCFVLILKIQPPKHHHASMHCKYMRVLRCHLTFIQEVVFRHFFYSDCGGCSNSQSH